MRFHLTEIVAGRSSGEPETPNNEFGANGETGGGGGYAPVV